MNNKNTKKALFTALVTPFNSDLEINYDLINNFVNFQHKSSVDGIVACGTTGEFASLTASEVFKIISVVNDTRKNMTLIAGISRNSIKETLQLAKQLNEMVDLFLIAPPFYFKPLNTAGLSNYFSRIFDMVKKPVILYHIPKYTGVPITEEIVKAFSRFKNFKSIKDSSGELNLTMEILQKHPEIEMYMGSDVLIYDALKSGSKGAISAISNAFPEKVKRIVSEINSGNFEDAEKAQKELSEIRTVLKQYPDISAQKHILFKKGFGSFRSFVRPPLNDLTNEQALELENKLNKWLKTN